MIQRPNGQYKKEVSDSRKTCRKNELIESLSIAFKRQTTKAKRKKITL